MNELYENICWTTTTAVTTIAHRTCVNIVVKFAFKRELPLTANSK